MTIRLANAICSFGMRIANVVWETKRHKWGWTLANAFARVADWMTTPLTETEWTWANLTHPKAMKHYRYGIISDRELARIVRSR